MDVFKNKFCEYLDKLIVVAYEATMDELNKGKRIFIMRLVFENRKLSERYDDYSPYEEAIIKAAQQDKNFKHNVLNWFSDHEQALEDFVNYCCYDYLPKN